MSKLTEPVPLFTSMPSKNDAQSKRSEKVHRGGATTEHFSEVRRQFGPAAAAYAKCSVQSGDFTLARLVELVKPQKSWNAVDIATGAGHTAMLFSRHVKKVVAVDLTPEMLDAAEKKAASLNLKNISFHIADAMQTGQQTAGFDLVTCRLAIHHFPDAPGFLVECFRLLRPGGILAIVDSHLPNNEALDEINRLQSIHDPSHVACLTKAQFVANLTTAGFDIRALEEGKVRLQFSNWVNRVGLARRKADLIRELMTDQAHTDTLAVLEPTVDAEQGLEFSFQRISIVAEKRG